MLEIDVDVGRLLALLTDETLEKEIRPFGIDRGDTEDVADRAVRRRSPARVEDVAAAREANDRVYRQKIGSVIEFADYSEFVAEQPLDLVGHAFGITILGRLPCHAFECLLGGDTLDAGFFGILIFEFVEREAAAIGDVEGARERRGIALVEPVHLERKSTRLNYSH